MYTIATIKITLSDNSYYNIPCRTTKHIRNAGGVQIKRVKSYNLETCG